MVSMYCVVATGITAVWTAGHINSDTQAALGMVNQCSLFLMVIIMAFSSGATAAVSQSLGADKTTRAQHYIFVTIAASAVIGLVIAGIGYRHGRFLLTLLQVPEAILPLAEAMWDISMLALPAQHIYAATSVIFRSTRMVLPQLWIGLAINAINVVLCLGLGLGFFGMPNLGYVGLLVATIVAQSAGALLNCLVLILSNFFHPTQIPSLRWIVRGLPYLIRVAVPAGLASFVWQTGYLFLFVLVASLPTEGVTALAGLTAGLRIESLLFLPGMAVNTSLAVLVGNCLGAGMKDKARSLSFRITIITTLALSVVALIIWPFREHIAQEFSPDPATQAQIINYLTYNLISTPFSIASTVMGGVMVGAGATHFNLLVYGGCSWLIRLPVGYLLGHILHYNAEGIFCAMLISQCIQATLMVFVIQYANWTKYTLKKHHP
ncbi:MAG: MATE family efflux transporter [Desulfovibrio sp.]|nr:MATE family efflux transporter [Desulfovibrio sp.]